jgi:hypothetical protein
LAQFTFDGQITTKQAGQIAIDGQSQSCAAVFASGRGIGLFEFLEDIR